MNKFIQTETILGKDGVELCLTRPHDINELPRKTCAVLDIKSSCLEFPKKTASFGSKSYYISADAIFLSVYLGLDLNTEDAIENLVKNKHIMVKHHNDLYSSSGEDTEVMLNYMINSVGKEKTNISENKVVSKAPLNKEVVDMETKRFSEETLNAYKKLLTLMDDYKCLYRIEVIELLGENNKSIEEFLDVVKNHPGLQNNLFFMNDFLENKIDELNLGILNDSFQLGQDYKYIKNYFSNFKESKSESSKGERIEFKAYGKSLTQDREIIVFTCSFINKKIVKYESKTESGSDYRQNHRDDIPHIMPSIEELSDILFEINRLDVLPDRLISDVLKRSFSPVSEFLNYLDYELFNNTRYSFKGLAFLKQDKVFVIEDFLPPDMSSERRERLYWDNEMKKYEDFDGSYAMPGEVWERIKKDVVKDKQIDLFYLFECLIDLVNNNKYSSNNLRTHGITDASDIMKLSPETNLLTQINNYLEQTNSLKNELIALGQKKQEQEKKKKSCFIATVVMGSHDHPSVIELRSFRDTWLLKRKWGGTFVEAYYQFGPFAAKYIENSKTKKKLVYVILIKPMIWLSRLVKQD